MSPTLIKIIVVVGAVLTIGALSFIIYNQEQHKTQLAQIQSQIGSQQQLIDGIVRAQSQYATSADLAKFAADSDVNLQAIQDNLKTLNAQLASITVTTVDSTPQTSNNLPSSSTGPANPNPPSSKTVPCTPSGTALCINTDPFNYNLNQQNFTLNEDFGTIQVPFGTVGFSAFLQNPWSVSIPEREYDLATVVGVDDQEKQTVYNKVTVKVSGKVYDLPIKNSSTEQQVPTASWSWWNPRLLVGLDGGLNVNRVKGEFTPSVNLGIMSYGQFKTTPDFSILEVGFGYGTINKTGEIVITPGAYNIGKKLFSPLMNNTYIGPSLQIGTDGSLGVGAGLRVGF